MADNAAELNETLDAKFRCVAALQRYAVMSPSELEDVELLLAEFPSLVIAYIEEEKTPPPAAAASMSNEDLFSGLAGRSGGSSESASSEALAAAEAAALNGGSTFYSCMVDAGCVRIVVTQEQLRGRVANILQDERKACNRENLEECHHVLPIVVLQIFHLFVHLLLSKLGSTCTAKAQPEPLVQREEQVR